MTARANPPSRHGGSNFFLAFRALPKNEREAIRAVYDFCRRADNAVDEAPDAAAGRAGLDRIRREIDDAFGAAAGSGGASRLAQTIRAFGLPRRPFDDLIEGVGWDLEGRRYRTAEDLRDYCRRVASTVGRLCVRIFGCADPACDRWADELGIALQWTNILRDVGVDLAQGRLYLPLQSLERHGLTESDLARRGSDIVRRLTPLVREEAAYARSCFGAADRALPEAERRRVVAGQIMSNVYRALLAKVERAGGRVLDREVRVSTPRRAWIAATTLVVERVRSLASSG